LRWLDDLISANTDHLADRIYQYVNEYGSGRRAIPPDGSIQKSLSVISAALLSGLRTPDEKQRPAPHQDDGENAFPSFVAEEASVRCKQGEGPDVFLKIVECCRKSYLDLSQEATLPISPRMKNPESSSVCRRRRYGTAA
jgi:hypothetical protein